ncbi:MAG: PHP domain-containing protein [Candidatus Woesearchaeota archaeon]
MKKLTPKKLLERKKQGYKALDAHVHTNHSRDVADKETLSPEALYATAQEREMDFVTFTDHDDIQAHKTVLGDKHVRGVELTVQDDFIGFEVHINIYDFTDKQYAQIQKKSRKVQQLLTYLHKHDLPHTYNHPFGFTAHDYSHVLTHPEEVYSKICWLAQRIKVLEINHSRAPFLNDLVHPIAKKYGNTLITGSDTHTGQIGVAYTLAKGDTFREWFSNVKRGEAILVEQMSCEEYFDTETTTYMDYALSPHKKRIQLETSNKIADFLIVLRTNNPRVAKLLGKVTKPIVLFATRRGIARAWYFNKQKKIAKKLSAVIEKNQ